MNSSSLPGAWDAIADGYDLERQNDAVYVACMKQVVRDLRPRGRTLDLGCGTGMVTSLLFGQSDSICALDFSQASLDVLNKKFAGRENLTTVHGDVRALPFPDSHFDAVLCANTLQHLAPDDQSLAVAEIMRVLRWGGRYAVSVHQYSVHKHFSGWKKAGKPGGHDADYIFRYSREDLARLFPAARIRSAGFYGWPGYLQAPFSRIAGRTLARLGHGHMLIAYGKKG